MQMTHLNL